MKETVHKDPYRKKAPGVLTWLLRLFVLFVALTACLTAGGLLYVRWLGAANGPLSLGEGAPDLNPARRLYLQGYLAARATDLGGPAGSGAQPLPFVISPGQSANEIAEDLSQVGLLDDSELFINYLRYHGLDSELEAGTYLVDPQATIPELAMSLTQSYAQEVELRFLEGWRAEEMAAYLNTITPAAIDGDMFLDIVQRRRPITLDAYAFADAVGSDGSLEGFLFPDTYRVPLDADADFLVRQMLNNFDNRVTAEMRAAYAAQGLSLREAVTLASIVERETPLPSERPLVAAVFYNRLEQGMRLQADPTVQYAVGFDEESQSWWKSPLTQADLDFDSPYNTYLYEGLPPSPIANPGQIALQAVAEPQQSAFLYFVADCEAANGAHLFSETYAEHVQNVERCR
ncbi:MAG TPA: endolytic transglycosylase MltG [Candidatus Sulfomarinibacteraceae bacterium]|nr:endolytic transglycosylase MltG [Candidatus Sulfomarinibacteraceae bacterium]